MDKVSPSVDLDDIPAHQSFPSPLSPSPLDVAAPITIVLGRFPMRTPRRETWHDEIARRQPWAILRHQKSPRLCQGPSHQSLAPTLTGS
jgi:hypothetical protein